MTAPNSPDLSIVVAIASDTTSPPDSRHLSPCLAALLAQSDAPPIEIIVPHPAGLNGITALRLQNPAVRFLEVPDLRNYNALGNSREHHSQLIAHGFRAARGAVVALIEDHEIATPEWSRRVFEAHREPVAAVGGAIENGRSRALNWAVYFCDFGRYQNPLPEGESARASDANVSYKRTALETIRPVWNEEFHEAEVNGALIARGEKLVLRSDVVVNQCRQGLRLVPALRERFIWGRSFGAWRSKGAPTPRRILWMIFSPALPLLLTGRMAAAAVKKRRTVGAFARAAPLVLVLTAAWAAGEFTGYFTRRAHSAAPAVRASSSP